MIKEPTCYKNLYNPTCVDLVLTNFPKNFQESPTLETGLSDFQKMVLPCLNLKLLTLLLGWFQIENISTLTAISLNEKFSISVSHARNKRVC